MACTLKVAVALFLAAAAAALICCHAVTDRAGACKPSDIHVEVARTGKTVAGQPEYRVIISNECACPQANVTVPCPGGLQSAEPVDESKIRSEDGQECMINDGMPIAKGSPVTFTYAWNKPLSFRATLGGIPQC